MEIEGANLTISIDRVLVVERLRELVNGDGGYQHDHLYRSEVK